MSTGNIGRKNMAFADRLSLAPRRQGDTDRQGLVADAATTQSSRLSTTR